MVSTYHTLSDILTPILMWGYMHKLIKSVIILAGVDLIIQQGAQTTFGYSKPIPDIANLKHPVVHCMNRTASELRSD